MKNTKNPKYGSPLSFLSFFPTEANKKEPGLHFNVVSLNIKSITHSLTVGGRK